MCSASSHLTLMVKGLRKLHSQISSWSETFNVWLIFVLFPPQTNILNSYKIGFIYTQLPIWISNICNTRTNFHENPVTYSIYLPNNIKHLEHSFCIYQYSIYLFKTFSIIHFLNWTYPHDMLESWLDRDIKYASVSDTKMDSKTHHFLISVDHLIIIYCVLFISYNPFHPSNSYNTI